MKKAVLLISFNRLDTTQKVFEQIRRAQPSRLYLASDGPRPACEGEAAKVDEVRQWLLEHIDWECEVKKRFLEVNSGGCKNGVYGAISWLFENEKDGIVLEDDCVPSQSFFNYCETLLDKYKNNKKIWHIAGYNPLGVCDIRDSYYFSRRMYCWGWAGWADRWQHYDMELAGDYDDAIKYLSTTVGEQKTFMQILSELREDKIDTWDYQWWFNICKHKGICINPAKNLISNIGLFGVHYSGNDDPMLNTPTYEIKKIVHPFNPFYKTTFAKEISLKYGAVPDELPNERPKLGKLIYRKEKIGNKRKIIILNYIKFGYKKRK